MKHCVLLCRFLLLENCSMCRFLRELVLLAVLWLLERTSVGLVYQCCLAVVAVVVIVLVVGVFLYDGPVVVVLVLECICGPVATE